MAKNKELKVLLFLSLIVLLYFLPFLIKPELLTGKDNDLGRESWPIYNFIKDSFINNKSLPLWRPNQMMGETTIGNPAFSLLYPANIIFLVLPVNFAVVSFYIFHFLLSSISTFYLARSYKLRVESSALAALLFTFSIKTLLHVSTGHITVVAAFALFPILFLSVKKILETRSRSWIIVGAFSVYGMLASFPTIFYYAFLFLIVYILYFLINNNLKKNVLKIITVFIMIATGILLSAVFLLPQLEFAKYSTRSNLSLFDVAQPIWNIKKFLLSILFPYAILPTINHEEFLYLGIVPSALALLGFIKLKRNQQIFLSCVALLVILFVLGLSTPFFKLVYQSLPLLKYSRVTTRLWFCVSLVVSLVGAMAVDKFRFNKIIIFILTFLFLVESFYISYSKILATPNLSFGNGQMYRLLASDNQISRVYCTTYCFNPQQIYSHSLETLHGETPLQTTSAVKLLQEAGNYSWSQFAVIFPPYQVWQVKEPPHPNSKLLGLANVRYVVSTYQISDLNLKYVNNFDNLYVYSNLDFKPRFYFSSEIEKKISIKKYSPNDIVLTFPTSDKEQEMVISEINYPGWYAYANKTKVKINDYMTHIKSVLVPANSTMIELKFDPQSFVIGRTITFATLFLIIISACYIHKRKTNGKRSST